MLYCLIELPEGYYEKAEGHVHFVKSLDINTLSGKRFCFMEVGLGFVICTRV